MSKPSVREISIDDLLPDSRNANRHTDRGRELVSKSMRELGAGRSVLTDKDGTLIAGNLTTETAKEAGITKAIVVQTTGDTLVVVERTDLDLNSTDDPRARQMALIDNSSALVGIDFDFEVAEGVGSDFGFDVADWGIELPNWEGDSDGSPNEGENSYSRKIEAPTYEPKNEKPPLTDLCDTETTSRLIAEIEAANLPKEEGDFLIKAAGRHNVFNYERIADYYAHASEEVQRLMENSALVIIDFNRAIELGFVQLGEEIAKQYDEEYGNE